MELRDQFAVAAMTTLLGKLQIYEVTAERYQEIVEKAYQCAHAMLIEREDDVL